MFFFLLGAFLTAFILVAITYLIFSYTYKNRTYPNVKVASYVVGGQTQTQLEATFQQLSVRNFNPVMIKFTHPQASFSATSKEIDLRLDAQLIAKRAFSIGRQTANPYYNFLQIVAAWQNEIDLPAEVSLDQDSLTKKINSISGLIEKKPVDAIYQFTPGTGPDSRGRVTAFRPSADGLQIDHDQLLKNLMDKAKQLDGTSLWEFPIPTKVVVPTVKSTTADDLGIKSLLGRGESYFYDSIPGRVYNIGLGTEKINGSLISPGQIFSFDQAIGTVSAVFGFQKAYSIVEGKTTLDDGGGVCQVSTTLYRAVLNAGLPVTERTAHTYRVGFYEQGGFLPGLDATVYPPSPDLKFKNDTGGWILIQTNFDIVAHRLTFDLFGTNDGRQTTITGPIIVSTSPPPDPVYEDDPTEPVGTETQVDTAHYGANVYFKRLVTRARETLINETVWSDFVPWPARFLRGTKSN